MALAMLCHKFGFQSMGCHDIFLAISKDSSQVHPAACEKMAQWQTQNKGKQVSILHLDWVASVLTKI